MTEVKVTLGEGLWPCSTLIVLGAVRALQLLSMQGIR